MVRCLHQDGMRGVLIVHLASSMWIPRTLRIGKVGVKAGLKWFLGVELVL